MDLLNSYLNSFGDMPVAFFFLGIFLLSSFGYGYLLYRILNIEFRFYPAVLPVYTASGLCIFTFSGLILGLSGFLSSQNIIFLILPGLFSAIYYIFFKGKILFKALFSSKFIVFHIFILLFLFLSLGSSMILPIGWDELCYQIEIPKRWAHAENINILMDNPFSAFPASFSILITIIYKFGGIYAPRLFNLIIAVLFLFSFFILMKSQIRKSFYSFILLSAFAFSSVFLMLVQQLYAETFILFLFAVSILILKYLRYKKFRLFSANFAYALALAVIMSVKLTGLIFGPVAMLLLYGKISKKNLFNKEILKTLITCFAFLLVLTLPFYLRTYVFCGNPFYPYFGEFFSSTNEASKMVSEFHMNMGSSKFGMDNIYSIFYAPILLSISEKVYDSYFGLQLIVFIGLFILNIFNFKKLDSFTRSITFVFFIFYLFWFFTSQQARFLLPAIFVLFLLALNPVYNQYYKIKNIIFGIILFLTVYSFPVKRIEHFYNSWKGVLGITKRADYLYSGTGKGYLKALHMLLAQKERKSTMLLFEHRGLYVPGKYFIASPGFQEKYFAPIPEKSSDIYRIIKQNNISHILIAFSNNDPDKVKENTEIWNDFIMKFKDLNNEKIHKIYDNEGYIIFRVKR